MVDFFVLFIVYNLLSIYDYISALEFDFITKITFGLKFSIGPNWKLFKLHAWLALELVLYYLHGVFTLHYELHISQVRYVRRNQVVMANLVPEIRNETDNWESLTDDIRIFAFFQPPLYLLIHRVDICDDQGRELITL